MVHKKNLPTLPYSPTEVKNKIMNNTSPLSTLTNKVLTGGLINAGKALQTYQPISYEAKPNNDIASANSLPMGLLMVL
ncbi:TPA: hypothetical protein QCY85_004344 [Bacillus cereus]|uniref:hypothetical protein n=1 Tax=Bacillus cereus group sp. FL70 TaxID=3040254 RepID=UPI003301543D|nr:hypothetical protein [Bacillus cereus]